MAWTTEQLIAATKADLAHFEAAHDRLEAELAIARELPGKPGIEALLERSSWVMTQIRILRVSLANPDPQEP